MIDGLDVVAVGIEGEGGEVAGVVGLPLAGSAVVAAACVQGGLVEATHRILIGRLKGEVDPALLLSGVDPELVGPQVGVLLVARDAQRLKNGPVESLARREVAGAKVT